MRGSECYEQGKEGGKVKVVGRSHRMQSLEAWRFQMPGILLCM